MIFSLSFVAALLATVRAETTCELSAGNYYCNEVSQVQFSGIGYSGQYNRVTNMDPNSGTCASEPFAFSGPMAPFDQDLSVHFRGPIEILQFGVYNRGTAAPAAKREVPDHHQHKREVVVETSYHQITQYVTVDQFGKPIDAAAGAPAAPATQGVAADAPAAAPPAADGAAQNAPAAAPEPATSQAPAEDGEADTVLNYNFNHQAETSYTGPSTITTSKSQATGTVSAGNWAQVAYYNAAAGSASGVTFLNNIGGQGSGVFDYAFGNSLSYCSADGVSCATGPQTLGKVLLPSNKEVIIFSDEECTTETCGYSRPQAPAYRGFAGQNKIFVFEFTMPTESNVPAGTYNYDMPAIWLLNGQIPRTLQYGKSECSCWKSGCGEFDLFEVLTAGEQRMLATMHFGQNGGGAGCSSYFARPVSGTMKAAVIMDGVTATLVRLDDSVQFGGSISDADIQSWLAATQGNSAAVQL